mmetsp:Transcript_15225/g.59546  ORF Transcript_15225/g.59546 Transcript_15225/m.59546 type:complete len:149 (-) Transcript_15225:42-488(-)|eukprot:CAMPEP_0114607826 /NCGR_PEP_ID=MMETSP0168-20121206/2263_1 /TAXON_ID=95228 ORGANISM="Vannella sp., Strain DIVA3 517/6/12" /NCGR_SAMPLE_ID=MMETSP0168 /ASSEMBLY_ACC=CAM_ASM_000044 /LENGTH=148 /DNA_ID=CAMNT_0001818705 /DNA_START=87 /DNA_END=533 /DNA_ORIENTATION=+
MNQAKLDRMAKSVRTGGKHSMRRKRKVVKRTNNAGDQKLNNVIKRLNANPIGQIDEINMFKADGTVIHFQQPSLKASIPSNTFVISGTGEDKSLQELLPGIIGQLGPEMMNNLRKLAEMQGFGGADGDAGDVPDLDAADDDVPALEEE